MTNDDALDCCAAPAVACVHRLRDEPHDMRAIGRCACGQLWYWRWHERVDYSGDGDDSTDFYARLTEDEVQRVLGGDEALLRTKPAIAIHAHGVVRITGVPG